jgi:hypothetical protein
MSTLIEFADHADRCSLCKQQHMPRTVFRCSMCQRAFCEKQLAKVPGVPFIHFKLGETVTHSFCGYAFPTEEKA